MTEYKKELKQRITAGYCFVGLALLVGIYLFFFAPPGIRDNDLFHFEHGMLSGIAAVALFRTIRYHRLLNDDIKLKLEYNKERDERIRAIRAKAGRPMILMTSGVIILAGLALSYHYPQVTVALLAVGVGQILVSSLISLIFMQKM